MIYEAVTPKNPGSGIWYIKPTRKEFYTLTCDLRRWNFESVIEHLTKFTYDLGFLKIPYQLTSQQAEGIVKIKIHKDHLFQLKISTNHKIEYEA